MITYPTLRTGLVQSLLGLRRDYDNDNAILNSSVCPYDDEQIAALKDLFKLPVAAAEGREVVVTSVGRPKGEHALARMRSETRETAADELVTVKDELQALRKDAREMKDVGDKIQILKVAVALVEKLTILEERHHNIKRSARFQALVIGLCDDLMPADVRDQFLARLGAYAESE